jgi:heat shock protein HslJ
VASGAHPANLAGTEWGFPGEAGKTARFIQSRSDGKAGGSSTGCNRFTGSYSQDRYKLTIGTLATTRKACHPGVMKREQYFLIMLEKVRRAEASHSTLTLKDADGNALAELKRRDAD